MEDNHARATKRRKESRYTERGRTETERKGRRRKYLRLAAAARAW
jgi:hypothetical protein